MKLWIDDIRDAPNSTWTEVRKVQPAIRFIANQWHLIDEISLDHDIENRPDDETFEPVAYALALCFQSYHAKGADWCPKVTMHTDNPVGGREMVNILKDAGLPSKWEPFTTDKAFKTKYGLH